MKKNAAATAAFLSLGLLIISVVGGSQTEVDKHGRMVRYEWPLQYAAEPSDPQITFTALIDGSVQTVNMAQYLPGVVAAEMPASFELEALKAQAVAARTYILSCLSQEKPNHPQADICTDSGCCAAWLPADTLKDSWGNNWEAYSEKICRAVSETDGKYLTWEGQPIQAVFHSSSAGRTADASELWNALPYLISVPTPESEEDVPNYISTVEVSVEDFRNTILSAASDAILSDEPASWLGEVSLTQSGRVAQIQIGECILTGQQMRTLFSLRATSFTLEYRDNVFVFTVSGYGHGVGMSQYGANVLAKQGADYAQILAHYFPGTDLSG